MALKIENLVTLRDYLHGVVSRADHHANDVIAVSSALIGFVMTYADGDIRVMTRNGHTTNVLWCVINKQWYAFVYNHNTFKIDLRERSIQGRVIIELDNNTTLNQLQEIFSNLVKEKVA